MTEINRVLAEEHDKKNNARISPFDLERAQKNNDIIKTLVSAAKKIDNKDAQKGILETIEKLSKENDYNLDHIPDQDWKGVEL